MGYFDSLDIVKNWYESPGTFVTLAQLKIANSPFFPTPPGPPPLPHPPNYGPHLF